MIKTLIVSLALTLVVECLGAIILKIRDKNGLKVVALANVITNPVVVFSSTLVWHFLGPEVYVVVITVLEVAAIIAETAIYKRYLFKDSLGTALKISLILNFCSYFAGELINMI